MLSAQLEGVGLLGPGLAGWEASAALLASDRAPEPTPTRLPDPLVLPPAERRRAGRVVRLALAIASEALARSTVPAAQIPSVFSSSGGDGDNCHEICRTLAGPHPQLSPTRFHNSVHNAPAGYWAIAQGCREPYTALCAYDASFGAGLLEALAQLAAGAERILLVCYDLDYPPPLRACRSITDAFGTALLLARSASDATLAQLRVQLCEEPPTPLPVPGLEQLRESIPAARGLPLLRLIARRERGRAVLSYLGSTALAAEVDP